MTRSLLTHACVILTCAHVQFANQFKCLTGGGCVDITKKCDGISHCNDDSDESKIICGKTPKKLNLRSLTLLLVCV